MNVPIVVFDGECAICNALVRRLVKADKHGVFHIVGSNSEVGRVVIERAGLPADTASKTAVVARGNEAWTESSAVFQILSLLPFPYKLLSAGRFLPQSLTDSLYRFVARHRRKLKDADPVCGVPSAQLRETWMARVVKTPEQLERLDQTVEYTFANVIVFAFVLKLFTVSVRKAFVRVDSERLLAKFGPVWVDTPMSNIKNVQKTGPYWWFKAIGIRESFVDHGLTFGSSTTGGVCVCFHEPIAGLGPVKRHPGLTMTVKDADRLVEQLKPMIKS